MWNGQEAVVGVAYKEEIRNTELRKPSLDKCDRMKRRNIGRYKIHKSEEETRSKKIQQGINSMLGHFLVNYPKLEINKQTNKWEASNPLEPPLTF